METFNIRVSFGGLVIVVVIVMIVVSNISRFLPITLSHLESSRVQPECRGMENRRP